VHNTRTGRNKNTRRLPIRRNHVMVILWYRRRPDPWRYRKAKSHSSSTGGGRHEDRRQKTHHAQHR
jgi:hypothetical protein